MTSVPASQTIVNCPRQVASEQEHYDSSPSPGSCYDTASESVEPNMLTCPAHIPPGHAAHVIHGAVGGGHHSNAGVTQATRYMMKNGILELKK